MEVQSQKELERPLAKGYVQVYTGNGKGKTTAAIGLAVRAVGAGLRVYFAQFIKGMPYSEIEALNFFAGQIKVKQYGRGRFIGRKPELDDINAAHSGLEDIKEVMLSQDYDIIIMDEANVAITCNLFAVEDLIGLVKQKPAGLELVVTGRNAAPEVLEIADLVTEMREVKHYYKEGVIARKGIEK